MEAIYDDLAGDDDHAPPTAPSISDLTDDAEWVIDEFRRVARGHDVAYHLSNALDALRRRCNGRTTLVFEDRDELIEVIAAAEMTALGSLPALYPAERVLSGMQAARGLAWVWNEDRGARSQRSPGEVADMLARARILQNDAHNLCLVEELAERAQKRKRSERDRVIPPQ